MHQPPRTPHSGTPAEVFRAFLKLGLTSFGGPIAHLGYFRDEIVLRRGWLDERGYADLVALCQFLPGPASSQTGFALGLMRAGWLGALAAFVAFTLPSAILLFAFAFGAQGLGGPIGHGALHGLKIVAVAIVAQAVWGMTRSLCPDPARAGIAVGSLALLGFLPLSVGMIAVILLGGLAGLALPRVPAAPVAALPVPISRRFGLGAALVFAVLLVVLPLFAPSGGGLAVFDSFYRAGSLVFGGGHVVLPLLEAEVVARGWISEADFLAGYGAAQAVPGPLFTFAAYLGALLQPELNGLAGAAIALVALFLPGFLLLVAALPFWEALRLRPKAQGMMRGANAAVVGILGAALYQPVFTGAIFGPKDFALAVLGFVALTVWKLPPWSVVALSVIGGIGLGTIGA